MDLPAYREQTREAVAKVSTGSSEKHLLPTHRAQMLPRTSDMEVGGLVLSISKSITHKHLARRKSLSVVLFGCLTLGSSQHAVCGALEHSQTLVPKQVC